MPFGSIASDRLRNINYERMRTYRLERTKQMMEEDGLDAIITWEPWDIRYIASAYVPMATRWGGQQFVVLPRNGEPHLFSYTCYATEALQEEMPWLNGRVWAAPEGGKFVTRLEQADTFLQRVCGILAEYGITSGLIGLDACPSFAVYAEALQRAGFSVTDPVLTMFKARMIKNEDELACVRYACYAADAAFAAIQKAIRPGVRECELQGLGMEALYSLGADETMDFVVASGPRVNPLHIDFTDRIVRPGDYVVIDINGNSFQGYKSCYYRTFICGEANEEQKEGFEVARKMMYDGMEGIKAGNSTADIVKGWPQSPKYWGYENWLDVAGYALGHGLGLSLHEAPQFFRPYTPKAAHTVLEEGMVMAVETWTGGVDPKYGPFGVRLEEDIVVTKDGYELLTKFPVETITECLF